MSIVCSKCKKEVNENARVCGNCGMILVGDNKEEKKEKIEEAVIVEEEKTADEKAIEEEKTKDEGNQYAGMLVLIFIVNVILTKIVPEIAPIAILVFVVSTIFGLIKYPKNNLVKGIFILMILYVIFMIVMIILLVAACTSLVNSIGYII